MATTDVSLCNRALMKLGITAYITALTDTTVEAETFNRLFAEVRDAFLSASPWPFATKRTTTLSQTTERDGWEFAYLLPTDCLQPRSIHMQDSGRVVAAAGLRLAFSIEQGTTQNVLLCDVEEPLLIYTVRATAYDLYHPIAKEALMYRLAAEAALPLTGKRELEADMQQRAAIAFNEAVAAVFEGQQEDPMPDSETILVRS